MHATKIVVRHARIYYTDITIPWAHFLDCTTPAKMPTSKMACCLHEHNVQLLFHGEISLTAWPWLLSFLMGCDPCLNGIYFSSNSGQQIWQQINLGPVCFHAKGERPGSFYYLGDGKLLAAMKLVYRSGTVRCVGNTAFDSRWGCYHHPSYVKNPLNVVVTDGNDNIIFPEEKYIKNAGLWYYLPFTDALHSDEIVFSNYKDPVYLSKGAEVKIWFGEDLRNWHSSDNSGRVCVDVYAHLQWLEKWLNNKACKAELRIHRTWSFDV